jgi:hypothetical protein
MKFFFVLFTVMIAQLISCTCSFAQMKLKDSYAGPSVALMVDKTVVAFSGNYEYEFLETSSGLFGAGITARYWNWNSDATGNMVIAGQLNYNFSKINDGALVPFVGLVAGTNFNASQGFYWWQGGIRYFYAKNAALTGRIGLGNMGHVAPEIGIDFRL